MSALLPQRSMRLNRALLLAALAFGQGTVHATGPDAQEAASPAVAGPEESAPAEESPEQARWRELAQQHGTEIADAIVGRVVLRGMTSVQVALARGVPARKDVIPPDAELWYYPDGEVAFAEGKVSYVDLHKRQIQAIPSRPASKGEAIPEVERPLVPEEQQVSDTATVHTPGDGFLALRSDPTSRKGKRLVKIPHGTRLTLGECVNQPYDGRWCRTSFRGVVGWVSDRYLAR
jgi:hypothetical protein